MHFSTKRENCLGFSVTFLFNDRLFSGQSLEVYIGKQACLDADASSNGKILYLIIVFTV